MRISGTVPRVLAGVMLVGLVSAVATAPSARAAGDPTTGGRGAAVPSATGTWTITTTWGAGWTGPLTVKNGKLTGKLTNTTGSCGTGTVAPGSTDPHGKLNMTLDMPACGGTATFVGTLNFKTCKGSGNASDSFGSSGTYTARMTK